MSGMAGAYHLDGTPIDGALIERMAEGLAFRGPDGRAMRVDGPVGMAHTLLCDEPGMTGQPQPCSLDNAVWVVADARIDARRDLVDALRGRGCLANESDSAAHLILRAYSVWGEDCVDHLLGDFSFAIWDGPKRRLFCARDQIGVKPFFYSHIGNRFVFSNTLDCVRMSSSVSARLDDLAIADFLMFGYQLDVDRSVFADVRRLPAGHCAVVSSEGVRVRRYWELPIEEPLYYPRKADYADQLLHLLRLAVGDRLPPSRVGVYMSGGLDSTSLAAISNEILRARTPQGEVRAFTILHEANGPDPERHFAGLAARHMGIGIDFRVMSDEPFEEPAGLVLPEPVVSPFEVLAERRHLAQISSYSRVALYGEGPDNALLYEWQPYLRFLRDRREWSRMVGELVGHAITHRRLPLLSTVPAMVRQRLVRPWWQLDFPDWLSGELVSSLHLRERWVQHMESAPPPVHPVRPRAYNSMGYALWPALFESHDAATTGVPLAVRHPWVDLRLLRTMLRVPVLPWCRNKYLLRYTMSSRLPLAVIDRPKAPLAGRPVCRKLLESRYRWPTPSVVSCQHVDSLKLQRASTGRGTQGCEGALRAVGFDRWVNGLGCLGLSHRFEGKKLMKSNAEILRELSPEPEPEQCRRPYQTPRLQTYGGLGDIVSAVLTSGRNDGGKNGPTKTAV